MKEFTIAYLWQTYNDNVIPKDAGPIQRQECKLAFYAGCSSMLTSIVAISDPSVPEEAGCALINRLMQEIKNIGEQPTKH